MKEACSNVKGARTSIVLKDISGIQGPERVKLRRGSGQARTGPGTPLNSNVIEGYPLSIKVKPRPRQEEVRKPYEGSRVRVPRIWGRV